MQETPLQDLPLCPRAGILTKLISHPIPLWTTLTAPILADFLSLHFVFTAGQFNVEVPFDPEVYFFGDEVVTGLRALTTGFDLYHPHRIVGWHCYDRTSRIPHWNDHPDWWRQHERSLDRLSRLFRGEAGTGEAGTAHALGTARTVADYEDHIMTRLVQPEE